MSSGYETPTLDIKLYRRFDYTQTFTYKSGGNPVNLSSHIITSQIWNHERTKKYVDFTCEILSPATDGKFKISLTDTQTTNLPDTAEYDIRLTNGGHSKKFIGGTVTTEPGYTKD